MILNITINLRNSFVFAFLIMNLSVLSQNIKIDSLKSIVEKEEQDTLMVISLNSLSSEMLSQGDITESLIYSQKASELATKLGYTKGKAYALKQVGLGNYYQGNYLQVFEYWTKSLENFEIINDSLGISNMLNNLGTVYHSQGSTVKAIDYYLQSLRIAEKIKNPLRIATALVNVAGVYGDSAQDFDKALNYYGQALPYLESLANIGLSRFIKNILFGCR